MSFVGTVVRDCEVRQIPSGTAILNVTLANNQGFGDKQTTLFIRCAVWGKRAEGKLKDYLLKGQRVFVSGELSQNEYEKDGVTKTSLELNVSVIDLVGSKPQGSSQAQQQSQQQAPQQSHPAYDELEDDIPF